MLARLARVVIPALCACSILPAYGKEEPSPQTAQASQEVPPKIQLYLKRSEEARPGAIKILESKVKEIKATIDLIQAGRVVHDKREKTHIGTSRKDPYKFPTDKEKKEELDKVKKTLQETQDEIVAMKNGERFPDVELDNGDLLQVGDIGRIGLGYSAGGAADHIVGVFQVVDDHQALVHIPVPSIEVPGYNENRGTGHVVDSPPRLVLLKGVSTKGITDGKGIPTPQVFEVTGTTTYNTARGSIKTVLVLEPFDTAQLEKYLKKKAMPQTPHSHPMP